MELSLTEPIQGAPLALLGGGDVLLVVAGMELVSPILAGLGCVLDLC